MKNILLIATLFSCLIFMACEEESSIGTVNILSVQAYLHAGEMLDSVKFDKVIPLDSLAAIASPNDLTPIVKTNNGESFPLGFTGVDGIYGNPDLVVEMGQSYTLEVEFNGEFVQAETFIPAAPEDLLLSDTIVRRSKIRDFTDLINQGTPDPIEITWTGEDGGFYFVDVENIENNPEVINELFEDGNAPQLQNILTEPSTLTSYAINAFQDITHYGLHQVTVYRVNPEYVVLYESNTGGTGSINEITTNVTNGFGIFTGLNSRSTFFEVKKP
ncbi:MAG: DUF4249 family protein [Bacteroidota bacterium]